MSTRTENQWLQRIPSLSTHCLNIVTLINNYGSYYQFQHLSSVPLRRRKEHTELPYSVCQASPDHIFVSFTHASRVCRFNMNGEEIWSVYVLSPLQICVSNHELYVANHISHTIDVFSFDGILKRQWNVYEPLGISYSSLNDQIIVATYDCLCGFTRNGVELWRRLKYFKKPTLLTVNTINGTIYAVSYSAPYIDVIDSNGIHRVRHSFQIKNRFGSGAVINAFGELLLLSHSRTEGRIKSHLSKNDCNSICTYDCNFSLKQSNHIEFENSVFCAGWSGQLIFVDRFHIHFVK